MQREVWKKKVGAFDLTIIDSIFGKIVDEMLEEGHKRLDKFAHRQQVKKLLGEYILRLETENLHCRTDEEIDFESLANYIQTEMLEELIQSFYSESTEWGNVKNRIRDRACAVAKADASGAMSRTVRITDHAFEIVEEYYKSIQPFENKVLLSAFSRMLSEREKMVFSNSVEKCEPEVKCEKIPNVLTSTVVPFADENNVIYREADGRILEDILRTQNKFAIHIKGFGGIGKTAFARMLYHKSLRWFDHIGWVEYHGNLKNSFLSVASWKNEIDDVDQRWIEISKSIKNDQSRKVVFIDNVDCDFRNKQNPIDDMFLQDIAGWPNMSVILTSRIDGIPGYQRYDLQPLGNEENPDPCVDLFYFYFDYHEYKKNMEFRRYSDIVRKLVKRAGYNSLAIEILAKGAVYEDSLGAYLCKIEEIGFEFPTLLISTGHYSYSVTATEQLRNHFIMQSRSDKEQKILWDFSVLPEGTTLTLGEVQKYLNYSVNDLHPLCMGGWLEHEKEHGFRIHPLIREVIHLALQEGKAPEGIGRQLVKHVCNNTLISVWDSRSNVLRKLYWIETAEPFLALENNDETALFYYKLGFMNFWSARKRVQSIAYLNRATKLYQKLYEKSCEKNSKCVAEAYYQLGYVESATAAFRPIAHEHLKKALDIWLSIDGCEWEIAMAKDHLGYVLSDSKITRPLARKYLTEALQIRMQFVDKYETKDTLSAYATTCDNLGGLFSTSDNKEDWNMAEYLLKVALFIRENLYTSDEKYATDVAWTSFNLGTLLSKTQIDYRVAERYFKRS